MLQGARVARLIAHPLFDVAGHRHRRMLKPRRARMRSGPASRLSRLSDPCRRTPDDAACGRHVFERMKAISANVPSAQAPHVPANPLCHSDARSPWPPRPSSPPPGDCSGVPRDGGFGLLFLFHRPSHACLRALPSASRSLSRQGSSEIAYQPCLCLLVPPSSSARRVNNGRHPGSSTGCFWLLRTFLFVSSRVAANSPGPFARRLRSLFYSTASPAIVDASRSAGQYSPRPEARRPPGPQ